MEPQGSTKTDHDRPSASTRAVETRRRAVRLSEAEDVDQELPAPERLGRFAVLGRLGVGGMGTVLEAYDETLDRRVAVKQLHRDASGEAGEHHRQRLLREAQALARLSHPNVVQVYDAGEQDGRLYIAMELVEGETLWEWQKTPRSWPECVRAYLDAAAGLAAAHAEGIVHRDFKPTNCVIDARGRVKVLDFGLARGVEDLRESLEPGGAAEPSEVARADDTGPHAQASSATGAESSGGLSVLSLPLTRTGAMLGTPAYMAPEQAAGKPAGARSDQFSLCVALYEALYGERPFPGNNGLAALAGKVPRFSARPRAGLPSVPSWLRKVLQRGLSADEQQRFASLDQLIAAVQRGLRRGRRLGLGALGLVIVLGGTAAVAMRAAPPCEGLRDAPLPGWTDEERAVVAAALEATTVAHAWEATAAGLDEYARGWSEARAQACEATHVQRVAGDELLELRMACLDRRAVQARATVELLAQADEAMAARSAQAVRSLPPLEPCLDAARLRAGAAPPSAALAVPAAEIRELVARSWAFDAAGRATQGLQAAEHAVADAERLGAAGEPLLAEALQNRGRLYRSVRRLSEARRDLESVLQSAERGGDQTLALEALQELLLVAHDDADRSAFSAWLAMARGKLRRFDSGPRTGAQLRYLEGLLALREGEAAGAVEAFEAAAQLYGELDPPAALERGRALLQLGVAAGKLGQDLRAEEAFESARVLADREGLLPLLADVHQERGRMHFDRGRPEPAEQWLNKALELRIEFGGPHGAITIPSRVPLAILLQQRGELPEAMRMAQAARESLGPSVPAASHAQVMSLLARFHRQQGDWNAALIDYQGVEEALNASPSPDPIELAMLESNVADCLRIMGRADAARTRYERALEGLRVHATATDYRHVYPLMGLGSLLAEQRDVQGAAGILRRALAIQEATPKDLDMGAMLRWELGRVLLDGPGSTPSERAEGLGLLRAAQDQFRVFDDVTMVAEIAAFLDRCGRRCTESAPTP